MPDAKKLKVTAQELRAQREAASRGEDYEVDVEEMAKFKSEKRVEPASAVAKLYTCSKCPRTFTTAIGLGNHEKWAHSADTKPKEFFKPQPEVLPTPVNFALDADGILSVGLTLDGLTLEEIRAEEAAARTAQAEREAARRAEAMRRQRIREAEEEIHCHRKELQAALSSPAGTTSQAPMQRRPATGTTRRSRSAIIFSVS